MSVSHSFALTDEQEQLRKEIRDFAAREIAPNVMRWDEASEFPHEVVKKLGEMGLMGVIFPAELGGAGLGYVDYALAVEELSAVDGSIGIIVAFAPTTYLWPVTKRKSPNTFLCWPPASGLGPGGSRSRVRARTPAAPEPAPCAKATDGC